MATTPSLNAEAKKVLLRKIPHGVFICGVAEGDEVNGFTASWVTQGSFEPPLVVMAVRADSTSNGMIQRSRRFSLNVLAADQKDLAAVFFKPQKGVGGRFDAAPFQLGELGLPILQDALGAVECALVGQVAPERGRGAVIGVFTLCGSLGIFFAAVVGGTLFDLWRPSAPYVVMGCLSGVLCLLAAYTWVRGPSPRIALN